MSYGRWIIWAVLAGSLFLAGTAFAHEWMAPAKAAKLKSPLTDDQAAVATGKELYQQNCSSCHGDTPGGLPAEQTGLAKATPDLKASIKTHTGGDFFWKIQEGRDEMPSFKDDLTSEEIWSIIIYIKNTPAED